jgi:endonuclease YncB( thermonuclease family)
LSIRRSSVILRPRFADCSHRPCEVHPAPVPNCWPDTRGWTSITRADDQNSDSHARGANLAPASAAAADNLAGQAGVIDGDKLEIHGTRIRLWGIDAPESSQLCRGEDSLQYRCGAKAANDLDAFIARRPVNRLPISLDRYAL